MQLYVEQNNRRFPCNEEHMLKNQGSELCPRTLVVKDQEEKDFWEGMRLMTNHRLIVTTFLDDLTEIIEDVIFFTFTQEETVRRGTGWVYRKFKS